MTISHPPHTLAGTALRFRGQLVRMLVLSSLLLLFAGCSRQYSVSVNEQMLYDPRPSSSLVAMADPGLQSCVNVAMRERQLSAADEVEIIACPSLEIGSLAGIAQLENLRYVDLAGNELVHLDELRYLPILSSVNAPDNALSDISGLLAVSSLTSAVLTGNNSLPCAQLDTLEERLGQNLLRPARCLP